MPGSIAQGRPAKGPRLFLRSATDKRRAIYIIRDGQTYRSTGCGADDRAGAEQALAAYIAAKHNPRQGKRDPDAVLVADVLNLYLTDKAPNHARPNETAARVLRLLHYWGDKTLSDVNGQTCRDYAGRRASVHSARRELEDLRAAIRYALWEGAIDREVKVTLPPKAPPRDRWLTRSEVAKLVLAAWRHVEVQNGKATRKHTRRHIARFILVALYTGSRSDAVIKASFERETGKGFIDLETGYFYRRPPGTLETKKRQPPIRLDNRLLAHLRRWQRKGQRSVVEFQGRPLSAVKRVFPRVVKDAGLDGVVTAHTLRHTAATWAMQNRANLWEAADYLGMTVATLEATYGHHHPDRSARAGAAIARRPGGKMAKQSSI